MKQTLIFLLVTALLLTGSWSQAIAVTKAASVPALAAASPQVLIGPGAAPRAGAMLDLNSTTQGILLPSISLNASDLTDFVLIDTDKASAEGMMVYNSNAAVVGGKGVYIWNGTSWKNVNIPATPVITISPATIPTLTSVGGTTTVTASVAPATANQAVTWSSSNTAVATVDASTGVITAVTSGTTTITATSTATPSVTATKTATVTIPVASLSLDDNTTYAAPHTGNSVSRTATITPTQAANKIVNWTSSNTDVATVPATSTSGNSVTITVPAASAGTADGTATITATSDGNSLAKASFTVTRAAAPAACEGLVVPNSKTGFISGIHSSLPTTAKSGSLCVYKWDGNGGTTSNNGNPVIWPARDAQAAAQNGFANTDASLFEGPAAGCENGYRLPSIVELIAIGEYFVNAYGGAAGPSGDTGFATWCPLDEFDLYWTSSSQNTSDDPNNTSVWVLEGANYVTTQAISYPCLVRCVKNI